MSESSTLRNSSGTSDKVFFGLPNVYVKRGSHIAHFFRGEPERLMVLAPFIQAGLAADQCILVTQPPSSNVILDNLRNSGVDVDTAVASGQLLISNGGSDVEEMSLMMDATISKARSSGRDLIRIAGDMTWSLGKLASAEELLEWEAFYDRHVAQRASFVALCQYDHTRFGGSTIMSALQTHPLSIIGSIVQENPFYRDPEEVLRELAEARRS